jgi:hypothetical protein
MKHVRPFLSRLRGTQPGEPVSPSRYKRSVTLSAIAFAFLLSGCATSPVQLMSNTSFQPMPVPIGPLQFAATPPPRATSDLRLEARLNRRERALLVPRSAPDCAVVEPKRPDAVDAAEWERAKLDYERSCYRQAEAATRDRLRRLQKVVRQTTIAAVPPPPVEVAPRRDDPFAPLYEREFGLPYVQGGFPYLQGGLPYMQGGFDRSRFW